MSGTTERVVRCSRGDPIEYYKANPTFMGTCACHSHIIACDGTEEKSYCMVGCNKCYKLIKQKKEQETTRLNGISKELVYKTTRIAILETELGLVRNGRQEAECAAYTAQMSLEEQRGMWKDLNGEFHYSRIFQSPILTIQLSHPKAGILGHTYRIHLERLTQVSSFFADRANNLRQTGSYKSSTFHPVAFKYFVQYLYSGNYFLPASHGSLACYIHTLIYFLADTLGAPEIKKLAKAKLEDSLLERDGQDLVELPDIQAVVKMVEVTYASTSEPVDNKSVGSDTGIFLTPASSMDGYTTDESDVATTVPETEEKTESSRFGVKLYDAPERELAQTLDCLDIADDETMDADHKAMLDTHPMRRLVSNYAAYRVVGLNKRADFRALLRRFPEFTVDMMIAREKLWTMRERDDDSSEEEDS
ncbi:hypothetical protein BJ508DRAFT_329211 [Ascobolus immersus RN42]|uniref:BTB domain-containing protein n=1 Tax=Ascobolus immersus RN42 TaxID=1160509 RepID=A0A3N4HX64_ASCIM|nr:hypothetical protein BJ508DRAFT_329211 [Ascobolus immersus RN42]